MTHNLQELFQKQTGFQAAARQLTVNQRLRLLKKLGKVVLTNRLAIQEALQKDFQKPFHETDITDTWVVLAEIRHLRKNLHNWAHPTKAETPLSMLGTTAYIRQEAKGTCLILSPWNYPVNLTLGPLAHCIAAGNTAIIKPSEFTPATSQLMAEMIASVFPEEHAAVVTGDATVSKALLQFPFDHIYFTGSTAVGKEVMKAAAENLSSVTLELGGKTPVYVHDDAAIKDAAAKITAAKMVNAGQSCIAPDYLIVHYSIAEKLIQEIEHQTHLYFSEKNSDPRNYSSIINEKHFNRLLELSSLQKDDLKKLPDGKIPLQIIRIEGLDVPLMQQELFGPILPVITVTNEAEAIKIMNSQSPPLSVYLFTRSTHIRNIFSKSTKSGSICFSECAVQYLNPALPFGGIRHSGIGRGHGKAGFLSFSNERVYFRQRIGITTAKLLYPPYSGWKKKLITLLLKYF